MRYIDVEWIHDNDDEPYRLVSEIDSSDFETRKLEFFSNDSVGVASKQSNTLNTMLGLAEVPPLAEIKLENEFQGHEISKSQFEIMWLKYAEIDS